MPNWLIYLCVFPDYKSEINIDSPFNFSHFPVPYVKKSMILAKNEKITWVLGQSSMCFDPYMFMFKNLRKKLKKSCNICNIKFPFYLFPQRI